MNIIIFLFPTYCDYVIGTNNDYSFKKRDFKLSGIRLTWPLNYALEVEFLTQIDVLIISNW